MSFLLDTNVVSELRKGGRCNPAVRSWFGGLADEKIFLSALTLGELRKGIELLRRRDPPAAEVLEAWLEELAAGYAGRVLTVDQPVAEEWGRRLNVPDPVPVIDGLLAATAKVHRLILVTRNTADVARTGVRLLNPFATSSAE